MTLEIIFVLLHVLQSNDELSASSNLFLCLAHLIVLKQMSSFCLYLDFLLKLGGRHERVKWEAEVLPDGLR